MASGASARLNSGSKGFDFGSDDILCSYEDYVNQDSSNAPPTSHPAIAATNSNREFHKTRMARSSVFPSSTYSPPEDSLSQDITATVERTMKKYADNMMRFLEGISSRLSQLELYCYNLDKTIGEMRIDLTREHEEADLKLRSMDKHLQEVHRSVQILRDKQELADTQKELARLQVAQKESSSSSHSQHGEERVPTPVPEPKKCDNAADAHNQQLALALPHQIAPQQQQQQQQYYMPPTAQLQNVPQPASLPAPSSQPQAPPSHGQFMPPPPALSHANSVQAPSFSQYQQNWPPQSTHPQQQGNPPQPQQQGNPPQPQQQGNPPQPQQLGIPLQPQARPQSSGSYQTYSMPPPNNQSPVDTLPSNMQMQSAYSGPPQQSMQAYGYGAPGRTTAPQQPSQQMKISYSPQQSDGYLPSGPHQSPPPTGYAMYEGGVSRMHYPPPQQQTQYPQGGYPPQLHQTSGSGGGNAGTPSPQVLRTNATYGELMEKVVNMGFRGDHVAAVIQRMEESGQAVDFNAVLDRLGAQASGGPQRGW